VIFRQELDPCHFQNVKGTILKQRCNIYKPSRCHISDSVRSAISQKRTFPFWSLGRVQRITFCLILLVHLKVSRARDNGVGSLIVALSFAPRFTPKSHILKPPTSPLVLVILFCILSIDTYQNYFSQLVSDYTLWRS
jgi:hypothetical protein